MDHPLFEPSAPGVGGSMLFWDLALNEDHMSKGRDEFVYDEATGEWVSAEAAAPADEAEAQVEVRDAVGNLLGDGDSVTLVKDLKVKGAGQTLKRGTVIRSIRLTGDAQEIDCRHEAIKGLVLRAEFVRKL
jgi:protein PhnA